MIIKPMQCWCSMNPIHGFSSLSTPTKVCTCGKWKGLLGQSKQTQNQNPAGMYQTQTHDEGDVYAIGQYVKIILRRL